MTHAVFYYKPDSPYDDVKGVRHHFPKRYLRTVESAINEWIVYYGPLKGKPSRYYTAIARVDRIENDAALADHYYAFLKDCLDFDEALEYSSGGGYETGLFKSDGKPNGGRTINAIRPLLSADFAKLITAGLSEQESWPARNDEANASHLNLGMSDQVQAPLQGIPGVRPIVEQIVKRPFREAKFRENIRKIYDRTCAFTGLRLINGKGRPEVEACHIIPVEGGGNDSVQNGIALSGTAHWMFDRGLLSLSDDFEILASRHLNYDVSHLLYSDMKARVPENPMYRPHPHYLDWHRTNKFKR